MRRRVRCCGTVMTVLAMTVGAAAGGAARAPGPTGSASTRPFFEARSHLVEYAGPGRDAPAPDHVDEVKIGWFGPADPEDPLGGLMWCAAEMALEEANASGGVDGIPLRMLPAWSANPWGTGVRDVFRLAYDERVWAVVGGPDGPSAHLAEQVVAKARLAFVSAVSTDKTTNLINVPWIFACAPGDHQLAPGLARAVVEAAGSGAIVLISGTDHDSRLTTAELLAALDRQHAHPQRHLQLAPGTRDLSVVREGVADASPGAVAIIAGAADSARLVIALRRERPELPIFGGPALGRRAFMETAGEAANGVVFPLLWAPADAGDRAQAFVGRFRSRFGVEPDYTATCTYDAVNLLVAAIRKAGLNRVRIRDAVRALSGWPGVTGPVTWDPTGQNDRPVRLGTIRDGRLMPLHDSRE